MFRLEPEQRAAIMNLAPAGPAAGRGPSSAPATCCCAAPAAPLPPISPPPPPSGGPAAPLSGGEVVALLRERWRASYDLQLVQRRGRLYLQVMWGHLEQQSFPLTAEAYGERLEALAGALNDLGVAAEVRHWLATTRDRPRLGRALSLPLEPPSGRLPEFLL